MAVQYSHAMSLEILHLFKVPQDYITLLTQSKISVEYSGEGISFCMGKHVHSHQVAYVTVKPTTISLAKQGKLGKISMDDIRLRMVQAIKNVCMATSIEEDIDTSILDDLTTSLHPDSIKPKPKPTIKTYKGKPTMANTIIFGKSAAATKKISDDLHTDIGTILTGEEQPTALSNKYDDYKPLMKAKKQYKFALPFHKEHLSLTVVTSPILNMGIHFVSSIRYKFEITCTEKFKMSEIVTPDSLLLTKCRFQMDNDNSMHCLLVFKNEEDAMLAFCAYTALFMQLCMSEDPLPHYEKVRSMWEEMNHKEEVS